MLFGKKAYMIAVRVQNELCNNILGPLLKCHVFTQQNAFQSSHFYEPHPVVMAVHLTLMCDIIKQYNETYMNWTEHVI
jgi:hypothetical protein